MVHIPLPWLSTGGYNWFFSGRIPARCFTATRSSNLACLSSPEKSCEASTSKPYPLLPLVGGINHEKMGAVCCWDHTMLLHWCCLFSFLSNLPFSSWYSRVHTTSFEQTTCHWWPSHHLPWGTPVAAASEWPGKCCHRASWLPPVCAHPPGRHGTTARASPVVERWASPAPQPTGKVPAGPPWFCATLDRSTALKSLDPHLAQRWLVAVHSMDLVLQHVSDLGASWIQLTFLIQTKIIVIWKTCRFHACEMHLFFDNLVTWTCLVIGPTYLLATFRIPGVVDPFYIYI